LYVEEEKKVLAATKGLSQQKRKKIEPCNVGCKWINGSLNVKKINSR